MKSKLFAGVAVLFFIMHTSAFAVTGQQVFDRYKDTEKKMEQSFKSMIMEIEINSAEVSTEATIYKKGNKMRVDSVIKKSANPMFVKAGQKSVIIDDGVNTTVFSPMMGKMTAPSEQAKEDNRKTLSVKLIGREKLSGVKCHKIKVEYQDGEIEILWVSVKDSILIKEMNEDGAITLNSDFRKINGFSMPYLSQTYEDGAVEDTTIVKSIKVRTKISNSKFDPSKVKGFKAAKRPESLPGFGSSTEVDSSTGSESAAPVVNAANNIMIMMQMGIEIQRLRMNGETEKADALELKMQKMTMGQ